MYNSPAAAGALGGPRGVDVWVRVRVRCSFGAAAGRQALPAAEKSRLEVHQGDYDAELDPALFDPRRFE